MLDIAKQGITQRLSWLHENFVVAKKMLRNRQVMMEHHILRLIEEQTIRLGFILLAMEMCGL